MTAPRFAARWHWLALCLSLLALCSALAAPAAALAQEGRSGHWGGLCAATSSAADSDTGAAGEPAGHCGLCAWPGLLAAPVDRGAVVAPPALSARAWPPSVTGSLSGCAPSIRGPPAPL